MELQSEKVATRSKKEQLIDIDLRNLATEIANMPPSGDGSIKFRAIMTQTGNNNPSASFIKTDITPISVTRIVQGIYRVLFTGNPLTVNTEAFISTSIQENHPGAYSSVFRQNANELTIFTRDKDGNLIDDVLESSMLSITVWP